MLSRLPRAFPLLSKPRSFSLRSLSLTVSGSPVLRPKSHGRIQISFFSSSGQAERFEFQAETRSLLDIVAKSLYSDQEVFIRELISNASDALEKRRCAELAEYDEGKRKEMQSHPYELRITTDSTAKTLVFTDTGIGMNREELIDLLGTIAKSGSKAFREGAKENPENAEAIIGQFGVGFYSAFVVSERVVVTTRKLGEPSGWSWTWSGGSDYELSPSPSAEFGTRIELSLRKDSEAEKFANPNKLQEVIQKYSFFLTAPILVDGERVNLLKALWMMDKAETTPEMHNTFFKQIAKTHYPHLANDRPQYTFQYKTDAPINIRSLLYVPSHKVSQLEFSVNSHSSEYGVSLYNRKVLVKAHAKQLLPHYFRFLVGVVDSEDIPLNLSREMLQTDLILEKIRNILTDRLVSFFVKQMQKDRVQYTDFYKGYSLFFKEGIVVEPQQHIKEEISKLLLFESSNFKAGVSTSLTEYAERMQDGQKSIYYLFAPSRHLAETSPYFELFRSARPQHEVLFIQDAADELVFLSLPQFKMHSIVSVEQWVKSDEGQAATKDNGDQKELTRDPEKKEFMSWMKEQLGPIKANEVRPDFRRTDSEHPLMITVSGDMGAARHLLRIGEIKDIEHLVLLKPVVHVNFSHPVVKGLLKLRKANPELAKRVAEQVFDNALMTAGLLKESSRMVQRINSILGDLMEGEKSPILKP